MALVLSRGCCSIAPHLGKTKDSSAWAYRRRAHFKQPRAVFPLHPKAPG